MVENPEPDDSMTGSKAEEEEEEEEVEVEEEEEEVDEGEEGEGEEEEEEEDQAQDEEPVVDESVPAAAREPEPTISIGAVPEAASQQQPTETAEKPNEPEAPSQQDDAAQDESFAALRVLEAQVMDKLSSGFKSALGHLGGAQTVTEATTNLTKMAGGWTAGLSTTGLSSWFTGGDSAPSSKARAMQLQTSKASNELTTLFNLDETEQLVESFKCKLLQTYACSHNSYTPAIQMAFQGTLHVTDQHVCFGVEERGKQLPIKVLLKAITASSRQLPAQKGGSDVLRLELEGGRHVAFKDFESGGGALDSALALIEHLTSPE